MTASIRTAQLVADTVLSATTEDERRKIATDLLAYSLGALAAIDGARAAAEVGYRHADAVVSKL